jgi:hypothetical protein
MPDVIEKQDALGAVATRNPRWIVISSGYAWRFLRVDHGEELGHVVPESQRASSADTDATSHMRSLFAEEAGYRLAHFSRYEGHRPLLPPHPLHASLACDIWVFERR